MHPFIVISFIFLFAGFIQGLSGFGSALLAMPLLTLFIDVKTAVSLCILNSLLMTLYLSFKLKDHMEWKKIFPLVTGSLPGIYTGVRFLKNMEPDVIKLLLGMLLVSYGFYALVFHPTPKKMHKVWAYVAGFGTGFIGSAFSAGGPPTIIYTTLTGWSRDHIKATLTGFFFVSASITAAAHAVNGLVTTAVTKYFSVSAFFVLIGVYFGSRLYTRINREDYIRIIIVILILLGLILSITAINGLNL